MKGNLCQLVSLRHFRRFVSSVVSFCRRFCSSVFGHSTILSLLKRASYICLALLVLGLSLFSGSSADAISFTQDVTLKYATSGPPRFRYVTNSMTSSAYLPGGAQISNGQTLLELWIRSNIGSQFNISAGNFIAVEFSVGSSTCDFGWDFGIRQTNESFYPLEVEQLGEYRTNSNQWCQQVYRVYFQSHLTSTTDIVLGFSGIKNSPYISVISAQIWEFTDWNKIFKTEDIVNAIKNQNNGASEIVAGINAGVNSLKQNDNANSQAQVGAINNAANQAHKDSQAQIDAIKNQTQQEKDQYDQEKKEESDRENQGKDDMSQATGIFNFNLLNPFAGIFGLFKSPSNCASIPTLASWVHSETSTVCSWWSPSVTTVLTPVFALSSMMIVFGFLVNWLGASGSGRGIDIGWDNTFYSKHHGEKF